MDTSRCALRLAGLTAALLLSGGPIAASDVTASPPTPRSGLTARVTPAFFNPSLGQSAEIALDGAPASDLVLEILDRDGFVVRRLDAEHEELTIGWDGRDDSGEVVPDEAYSLRIVREGDRGARSILYDPKASFSPEPLSITDIVYARQKGILGYTLPVPARVHIQAGQARAHPETGEPEGPVLKTVVDRESRAGGAVVENWNGRDESGTLYVPDLPNFAVSVLAVPLPENSLITVGNRDESFLDYARRTRPAGAPEPRRLRGHMGVHTAAHSGLNAFEDRSPALEVTPDSELDERRGAWVAAGPLSLRVEIDPAAATYFLRQPTELFVFVDAEEVQRMKNPENPAHLTLTGEHLPPGDHRVVVNWASELGPVGVQTIRVHVPEAATTVAEGRR